MEIDTKKITVQDQVKVLLEQLQDGNHTPLSKLGIYYDLLSKAKQNYAAKRFKKSETLGLKPYQCLVSLQEISEEWGWTKHRITDFLESLEENGIIETMKNGHQLYIQIKPFRIVTQTAALLPDLLYGLYDDWEKKEIDNNYFIKKTKEMVETFLPFDLSFESPAKRIVEAVSIAITLCHVKNSNWWLDNINSKLYDDFFNEMGQLIDSEGFSNRLKVQVEKHIVE